MESSTEYTMSTIDSVSATEQLLSVPPSSPVRNQTCDTETLKGNDEAMDLRVSVISVELPQNKFDPKYSVSYAITSGSIGIKKLPYEGFWMVYASEDCVVPPGKSANIETGVFINLSDSTLMHVDDRTYGYHVLGGILEEDDCGSLKIIVNNVGNKELLIKKDEPLATMQFNELIFPQPREVNVEDIEPHIKELKAIRVQRHNSSFPRINPYCGLGKVIQGDGEDVYGRGNLKDNSRRHPMLGALAPRENITSQQIEVSALESSKSPIASELLKEGDDDGDILSSMDSDMDDTGDEASPVSEERPKSAP